MNFEIIPRKLLRIVREAYTVVIIVERVLAIF
jgi:hypothetical protein